MRRRRPCLTKRASEGPPFGFTAHCSLKGAARPPVGPRVKGSDSWSASTEMSSSMPRLDPCRSSLLGTARNGHPVERPCSCHTIWVSMTRKPPIETVTRRRCSNTAGRAPSAKRTNRDPRSESRRDTGLRMSNDREGGQASLSDNGNAETGKSDTGKRLGIATIANDKVYDWVVPFLESWRVTNRGTPLYVIPYDDNCDLTRRACEAYRRRLRRAGQQGARCLGQAPLPALPQAPPPLAQVSVPGASARRSSLRRCRYRPAARHVAPLRADRTRQARIHRTSRTTAIALTTRPHRATLSPARMARRLPYSALRARPSSI